MEHEYEQLSTDWSPEYMSKFLSIFPTDTVWKWILILQDGFIFGPEMKIYSDKAPSLFSKAGAMANIAWGDTLPLISRKGEFGVSKFAEVGISLKYLFQGDAKAQEIIQEIGSILKNQTFDVIRLHLISQMIKHHGLVLECLNAHLSERGKLLVADADDTLNFYEAPLVKVAALFDELTQLQREAGGQRSASERVLKSASRFGFRVLENESVSCTVDTQEQRVTYYRLLCLKLDLLTKIFGDKYSRIELFTEAHQWLNTPSSRLCDGLKVLILEKRSSKFVAKAKATAKAKPK